MLDIPQQAQRQRTEGVPSTQPAERTLRVLVVDDEDGARCALEHAVRLLGHECRSARDGREAWEMQKQEKADVILSDWMMPRMDGLELCERVRAAEHDGYTYFILLTSYADKAHFLRGMAAGADDYHAKPVDMDELQARLLSAGRVVSLHKRLAAANNDLVRDSQHSFKLARIDPLTGLGNRLSMHEDMEVLWSRAQRYGHAYTVGLCDIDEFKAYNDQFGHLAGDEVLRDVAQSIRRALRQGDTVYRYGGEEFLVVLPEQSLAEATQAMDRVRESVERLCPAPDGKPRTVTISVGLAELDRVRDETADMWLRRADAALYRAKAAGRNRVEI